MRLNRRTEPTVLRDFRSTPTDYQTQIDADYELESRQRFAATMISLAILAIIVKVVLG